VSSEVQATAPKTPQAPEAPEKAVERGFISAQIHRTLDNIKAGELGSWPLIIAMVVVGAYFYHKNANFLSGYYVFHGQGIVAYMAPLAMIATGVTFVLLIAEIDLSVAYLSALAGEVFVAELALRWAHLSDFIVIPIVLVVGALLGLAQGLAVAYIRVPSFIVTLAGLLVAEGVVLKAVGSSSIYFTGHNNLKLVMDLETYTLTQTASWIVAAVVSLLYALAVLNTVLRRRRLAVDTGSLWFALAKVVVVDGAAFGVVAWANRSLPNGAKGLPLSLLVVLAVIVFWTFIATRTTFGQHVYAVGGNAEAARRAGINVPRIKAMVFMISGMMAAVGGMMMAGYSSGVTTTAGGDPLLMYVIAAAVIGGTSLFGGRGEVKGALLGALVLAMINAGCVLSGYGIEPQYLATAFILLAAVTVDTIARKRQEKAGR
jgi:D-xylose transport system permease protein